MSNFTDFTGGGAAKYQFQLFTSSGTFTLPAKLVGDTVRVTAIGGGGSGCLGGTTGTSWGGNSGAYAQQMAVSIAANQTVTIGAGGLSPATGGNANGLSGGNTVFGSLTFVGGGGGSSGPLNPNNTGGAVGGAYNSANAGYAADSPLGPFGGNGGHMTHALGGPGAGGLILDSTGIKGGDNTHSSNYRHYGGRGYGAGGAAYASTNLPSGAGAQGAVLVEWMEEV